jgi:hypothetical protein
MIPFAFVLAVTAALELDAGLAWRQLRGTRTLDVRRLYTHTLIRTLRRRTL